ncbi:alpha-E domain-containing protein [Tautonia sociabilis]|uniref:Alpha-E domain-containing protein n=1 Tax=Tautonia sociabilis TaxID=2080755 RepID=A0A432MGT3_9BACT|nr:alpha-E domain-containing protein [Tautonia sociabilis]RUL85839.1 alpha-E domain-containing protein [Tautonia sociabilis]
MLSRVAENLYWISRYVERAENVARLLDVGFHLELDASGLDGDAPGADPAPIASVLSILACRDAFERAHGPGRLDREAVMRFLTFDRGNDQSIVAMLGRARENARATQETISAEAWHQLNRLHFYLQGKKARRRFADSPPRFLQGIKRACILFDGLVDGTLPRTEIYHFLQLGRHLERANQISRILSVKLHGLREGGPVVESPLRIVHWSSLLWSCAAYEAYLRDYHDRVDPEGVVRYLILDPEFPRSIRFCVSRCLESLRAIAAGDGFGSEAERCLGRLDSELHYIDPAEIFERGLGRFLSGVQDACNTIGDEIHQAYFFT